MHATIINTIIFVAVGGDDDYKVHEKFMSDRLLVNVNRRTNWTIIWS